MAKECAKTKCLKSAQEKKESKPISYRLKCAKTANGLSHYVMYGDVNKKESLL